MGISTPKNPPVVNDQKGPGQQISNQSSVPQPPTGWAAIASPINVLKTHTTGQANNPPGIPQHVTAVSAVTTVGKNNVQARVTFLQPNDPNYVKTNIYATGYKGSTQPVLVGSGNSPVSISLDNTGENVRLTAVAAGNAGEAHQAAAPSTGITLGANQLGGYGALVTQTATKLTQLKGTLSDISGTLDNIKDGTTYIRTSTHSINGAVPVVNSIIGSPPPLATPGVSPNTWTLPGWITAQVQSGNVQQIFDILLANGTGTQGYVFRVDNRSGQSLLTIWKFPNLTTSNWTLLASGPVNSAIFTGWTTVEIYMGNNGLMQIWNNGVLAATATDTTYAPSGSIQYGFEINNVFHVAPSQFLQGGSTSWKQQGSITSVSNTNAFSYSASTTSISWSWTPFTIFFADGTVTPIVASGGANGNTWVFSGLTANSTYYFQITYDVGSKQIIIYQSDGGINTPGSVTQISAVNGDGTVPLNINVTAATPATGTGSGGGTGGGGNHYCFSPSTYVKTKFGNKTISAMQVGDLVRTARGTWRPITEVVITPYKGTLLDMGNGELVKTNHRFLFDGEWVPALAIFSREKPYDGDVYNLHVDGRDDMEHSYTLGNEWIVHNFKLA